jgi:hypothetical protein
MKMIVEKQMECRLAGEIEVLGENLPQRHFLTDGTVARLRVHRNSITKPSKYCGTGRAYFKLTATVASQDTGSEGNFLM